MQLNTESTNFINNFICQCSKVQTQNFEKNDVITTYIEKRNQVCILAERRSRFNTLRL